jgi:hypothetical protein
MFCVMKSANTLPCLKLRDRRVGSATRTQQSDLHRLLDAPTTLDRAVEPG